MNPETSTNDTDQGLQAWQFFVLAGLACATAATFMARGQSIAAQEALGFLRSGCGDFNCLAEDALARGVLHDHFATPLTKFW